MRHPCETGYDYAEGYPVGEKDKGDVGWIRLKKQKKREGKVLFSLGHWRFFSYFRVAVSFILDVQLSFFLHSWRRCWKGV